MDTDGSSIVKPTVVLMHGMWSTGETLSPIQRRFESWGYPCLAPTLPHHANGGDANAVGNLSHQDYVGAHLATIASQRWSQPPILVGHSMGGLLAQLVAAQTPARALVLFAPGLSAGKVLLTPSAVRSTIHITRRPLWWKRAHIHPTQVSANRALFTNLPVSRQQELFRSLVPESGRAIFEAGFWFLDRRKATRIDFANLSMPIIILHGNHDAIVAHAGSVWLQRKYANVTLKSYTTAGHWLFEEPGTEDVIFADLKHWLDQTLT
jgi:pimeloyl-ACP methyl ester carboxylesterase